MPRFSHPELDPDSYDVPEHLPGGAVWWTRHTASGVKLVLELPEGPDGHALDLLLLEARGGRTRWAWRTERGAVLRVVEGWEA